MNNQNIKPKTTTLLLRNSINRSPWRRYFLLVPLLFVWLASSSITRAVDPQPDGGYANFNTAEGDFALFFLATGANNTAIGNGALFRDLSGSFNTGSGASALEHNTAGNYNTASGYRALFSNNFGDSNTATGYEALYFNTNGSFNTAHGSGALYNNTTGIWNTAVGWGALYGNSTGNYNTAGGLQSLFSNTTGNDNTASGLAALYSNITGGDNTASGVNALYSNTTGSNNIALGAGAGGNLTTGSNNIDIGNGGVAAEANTIRIGTQGTQTSAYCAGISGSTIAHGMPVVTDASGRLGVKSSSARFKEGIKPMDKASEAILALRPVTFRYKKEIDSLGIPQFGLVAEEVEKVNPDLVVRGADGKVYTVRYDAVNAMLLNEFLKEHKKVEEQQATIAELKSTVAQQQKSFAQQEAQIQTLTSGLQKVSAQVEIRKPRQQMVLSNR